MSGSNGGPISAVDCCFTGVAVGVLAVQSGWSLAKRSAQEGRLTCSTGTHEVYRFVRQCIESPLHLLDFIREIVVRVLKEVSSLFLTLRIGIKRSLFALGGALQLAAEGVVWVVSPLSELGGTCQRGVHATLRALRGCGSGFASGTAALYALTAPCVREACQTAATGFAMSSRTAQALSKAAHAGFDLAEGVLGGVVRELIDLFVSALEMIGKTGRASKGAVKSWLSLSRESSYCLLMEAASTLKIGYGECLKMVHALPPAVRAFCFLPVSGTAALLKECAEMLEIGARSTIKSARSAYQGAAEGIDLLRATLVATLFECLDSGAAGLQQTQMAFVAAFQAINHGTEEIRSLLFDLLREGSTTLSVGGSSSVRAARAGRNALLHAAEIVPPNTLLDETAATLRTGRRLGIRALTATAGATVEAAAPLSDLAYRASQETLHTLKSAHHQARKIKSAAPALAADASHLVEWPVRSAAEVVAVAQGVVQSAHRFNYQMNYGVADNMRVFVYYPLEELISPKLRAVSAALARARTRLDSILARFA